MTPDPIPDCPHCQSSLKPERITAQKFICPCCARQFTQDQVLTWQHAKKP